MYNALKENLDENQVVIKSAAVADYKPKNYSDKKIKKSDDDLSIKLDRTKDIAYEIGKIKNNKILVGFAAVLDVPPSWWILYEPKKPRALKNK